MKKITGTILLSVLACSCGPKWVLKSPSSQIAAPNRTLLIAPLTENIEISYQGDVRNEFGEGKKEDLIAKYFLRALSAKLGAESCYKNIVLCQYVRDPRFSQATLPYRRGMSTFSVPDAESVVFENCNPDIVLFISNLKISSVTVIGSGFSRSLSLRGDFLYWDAKTSEILAYGRFSDSEDAGFAITLEEWEGTMRDVVEQFLLGDYLGMSSQ